MLEYLARRLGLSLLVLWVIATITFFLMHSLPGGPFTGEKSLPEAIQKNLEERYQLQAPVWQRYRAFLGRLLRFDLGPSYRYLGKGVNQILTEAFPVSATLGCWPARLWPGVPLGSRAVRQVLLTRSFYSYRLGMILPTLSWPGLIPLALSWAGCPLPCGAVRPFGFTCCLLALLPTALVTRLVRSSMAAVLPRIPADGRGQGVF